MSQLSVLVGKLREDGGLTDSEEFSDQKLEQWLNDAIRRHDPTANPAAIDDTEDEAVVLLAQIQLCYARAAKWANDPSVSGGAGYGTDRNTPYYKNMDMAARLQDRYARIVLEGASDPTNQIVQGHLTVINPEIEAVVTGDLPIIPVVLSKIGVDGTNISLKWQMEYVPDFADYFFYVDTATGIYQVEKIDTNSEGVPKLRDTADLVHKLDDQFLRAVEFIDAQPNTDYYFILVMKTRRGTYYYSNEVFVHTGA